MCMNQKKREGDGPLGAFANAYLSRNANATCDAVPADKAGKSTARRKLWDLAPGAHCPVAGVCLRLEDVKRLASRAGLLDMPRTEYDLHVVLVAECRTRTPLAEQVQRALDKRYETSIRSAHQHKTEEALAHWWDQSIVRSDWAGVFWALLTHPKCSTELEYLVLGQVHMLQHQNGMATRVDHTRLNELASENQRLGKALDSAQRRTTDLAQTHARLMEQHQADMSQMREALIRAQTAEAHAQTQLDELRRQTPGLAARERLVQDKLKLLESNSQLRRALRQAEQALQHTGPYADPATPTLAPLQETDTVPTASAMAVHDRSVLCVGGRQRVVPIYREVIEERGARFSHHDGGSEDKVGQLGHLLQAADLVVCQVGCVSHDAYWRVKEHCKRHNKPCLFVETPSRSGIERALQGLTRISYGEPPCLTPDTELP